MFAIPGSGCQQSEDFGFTSGKSLILIVVGQLFGDLGRDTLLPGVHFADHM